MHMRGSEIGVCRHAERLRGYTDYKGGAKYHGGNRAEEAADRFTRTRAQTEPHNHSHRHRHRVGDAGGGMG